MKTKRIIFGVLAVFIASCLLFACSAERVGDAPKDNAPNGLDAGADESDPSETGADTTNRKIIYTYNGTVYADDVADAVEKVKSAVASRPDAYIESSSQSADGSTARATFKIRVRSADLDAFLAAVRLTGEVRQESLTSDDVTKAYFDLAAKKAAKEAEEARLFELYQLANNINDISNVSNKIAAVQAELNAINSALANYDSLIALSTVNLSIYQTAAMPAEENPAFGEKVWNALKNSGKAVAGFFEFLLYAVIYVGPFAAIGAGVFCAVWIPRRRARKKTASRHQDAEKTEGQTFSDD